MWHSDPEKHESTHTGEKSFQCDVCENNFRESTDLNEHILVHTDENTLQCQTCRKSYIQE